jgi:hypothetical protein
MFIAETSFCFSPQLCKSVMLIHGARIFRSDGAKGREYGNGGSINIMFLQNWIESEIHLR